MTPATRFLLTVAWFAFGLALCAALYVAARRQHCRECYRGFAIWRDHRCWRCFRRRETSARVGR